MLASVTRITDVIAVLAGGWLAYRIRMGEWLPERMELLVLLLATAFAIIAFPLAGAYRTWLRTPGVTELLRALAGWFVIVTALIVLGAATKTTAEFSRLWMGYWTIVTSLLILTTRTGIMAAGSMARKQGLGHRRIGIVGTGDLARHVADSIAGNLKLGLEVRGFITADSQPEDSAFPVLGHIGELEELSTRHHLREIWIALPLSAENQVEATLKNLQNCLVTVRYIPDIFSLRLLSHVPTRVADLLTIELNASPLQGAHRVLKTVFDYLFATCALILVSPILVIASLAIKLTSPGPVFFTQRRHGSQGRPIRIYKFRTMYENAEQEAAFVQATKDDPRVTPVGRFLRRTSLDELPQFINVLQGRLSVVGPRPHAIAHNDEFKDQISAYMQRHRVKPGITGWAQVNGLRGETDTLEKMRKRIEFDLFYIENWSFWLDLKIIFLTALFLFGHENAY
jgi:putative colanic acid biosynthesis UDP-glucose lipid carrier transferase